MIEYNINITLDDNEIKECEQDAKQFISDFDNYQHAVDFFTRSMIEGKIQSFAVAGDAFEFQKK